MIYSRWQRRYGRDTCVFLPELVNYLEEEVEGTARMIGEGATTRGDVARPGAVDEGMAKLRQAARICGAVLERWRERSSPKVTSRTSCKPFSICQWPRIKASKRSGLAWAGVRVVMRYTVSVRTLPVADEVTVRVS